MAQTNMQKAYQLMVFMLLIGLSMSRPNGSADTQDLMEIPPNPKELPENQLSIGDLERSIPLFRPLQNMQYYNYDEPRQLDRFQLQFRPYYPSTTYRGSSNMGVGGGWDPYQTPVNKRQSRYRQCYFNPISCFRK